MRDDLTVIHRPKQFRWWVYPVPIVLSILAISTGVIELIIIVVLLANVVASGYSQRKSKNKSITATLTNPCHQNRKSSCQMSTWRCFCCFCQLDCLLCHLTTPSSNYLD